MKTRTARAEDVTTLVAMRCALLPEHEVNSHEQYLRAQIDGRSPGVLFVLDGGDGQICGYAELQRRGAGMSAPLRVQLNALYVIPSMRRRGGGGLLIEAAQRWAHAQGARSIDCDLAADNTTARARVAALGFNEDPPRVRASLVVSAPLQMNTPEQVGAQIGAQVGAGGAAQLVDGSERAGSAASHTPRPRAAISDDEPVVVVHAAPRRGWMLVNIVLLGVMVFSFMNTDIYASDPFRGVLMPLLDVALVVYFLLAFVIVRYRKRADSSARADQLFRVDE